MDYFENWNKNSKKFTNLSNRNYNTNPLILREYRREFYLHIILNFIVYFYGSMIFFSSYEAEYVDFDVKVDRIFTFFIFYFIFLFLPFLMILISKPRYVKLTGDKKAVYCGSDMVPRKNYSLTGKKELVGAYHAVVDMKWFAFGAFILLIFAMIRDLDISEIMFAILFCFVLFLVILNDFLLRMMIYKLTNKSLKNFWKYWLKCIIDIGWSRGSYITKAGATLYFFSQKDHDELREYFLANFRIDIDSDIDGVKLI